VLLRSLDALDQVQRHTHPGRFEQLGASLAPLRDELEGAFDSFQRTRWPAHLEGFAELLGNAGRELNAALVRCTAAHGASDPFVEWLRAMRGRSVAMESLYPLAATFSPVNRFFLEPAAREWGNRLGALEAGMRAQLAAGEGAGEGTPERRVGMLNASNTRRERGGFSLYVPEFYEPEHTWPIVVALHGGSGHGADFLWTWLREARTRGFFLLAPTARGGTWSLMGDDVDAAPLLQMVEFVRSGWEVDPGRILLTGMSDGATYTTLLGLAADSPFSALAPLCGIFHPMNALNGNAARIPGRRIYLLHGALDWMFPVDTARNSYQELLAQGADVTYREVPDLSHTYPRDENDAILRWFDPALALPEGLPREEAR